MKKSDIIKYTLNLLDHFPDVQDKEIFVDKVLQFQELKMSLFKIIRLDYPQTNLNT